jgi:hypothetical protein
VVPGPTASAAAVVLNDGVVVASLLDVEKAAGFVAMTQCERPAFALGRGPSTDLATGLSASDLLLSIIVAVMIISMIIVDALQY